VVFTYFSPSAEAVAARVPAEVTGYLPYDVPSRVVPLLRALAPDALVFAKLDVWPELALAAARAETPVVLVAGTVSPVSGRLRGPARMLLRPAYAALAAVGAISTDDRDRLLRLGVRADCLRVLGDPRFDSVMELVTATSGHEPLHRLGVGGATLVAGSTWPPDEAVLLPAFRQVLEHIPNAQLLLAPHEPTRHHLDAVRAAAARHGLPQPVLLSAATAPAPFLLVDRVGVLARLYGAGQLAYVGGGFGRAGLHSVLEPAAWGRPVLFGPEWRGSRDAGLLLDAGGGTALPRGRKAVRTLTHHWIHWAADEAARAAAGRRAFGVVQAGLGAADRNAELVEEVVERALRTRERARSERDGP
jgi:3-deoxy-D-manno-octulosonic-acid transferase